ncbi:MAG: hypothetical protein WCT49_05650 [Candidatus Paceibacterota bacterium]|jgi:hypothetical protein|nr:hypothetical protein [Candidatus Paceibacterota bacterium]
MKIWKGVVTHPQPHDDEIKQMFLFRDYGDEKYPGIRQAIIDRNVLFLREDQFTMSREEYENNGQLLLGVGGGDFDEHATANNHGRKEGECGATLVARKLGVDKLPELKKILQYTLAADLNSFTQLYAPELESFRKSNPALFRKLAADIAMLRSVDPDTTVKLIHEKHPDDPWVAIEWDFTAIEAKLAEQHEFHVVAPKAAKSACVENFSGITFNSVESDCPVIAKYLRSKEGGQADVVVQKSPTTGQVQIFTNNQAKINTDAIAKLLRLLELKQAKKAIILSEEETVREGTLENVPEWYYFKNASMLFNGSRTAPNTPATQIPFNVIIMAIRFALLRPCNNSEINEFVRKYRVY